MDHSIYFLQKNPFPPFYPKPLNMRFYNVAELKATIWCSKKAFFQRELDMKNGQGHIFTQRCVTDNSILRDMVHWEIDHKIY